MKKILLVLAMVMTMSFGANAQSDGWFKSNDGGYMNRAGENNGSSEIGLPNQHGLENDPNAPLGSGLLILTALGAGYALKRRKE